MHELVTYTDFLVLCTGRNTRLTRRIAEEVSFKLKQRGRAAARPGARARRGGEWILLDFLDFVVHVFTPEAREFYRLDVLWKQAPVGDGGVSPRRAGSPARGQPPSARPVRLHGPGAAAIIRGRSPWGYSSAGRARRWQR